MMSAEAEYSMLSGTIGYLVGWLQLSAPGFLNIIMY
jgi:hypothetical protein